MSRLRMSIVTPSRNLVDIEVDEVTAPGANGEFCVLPDHDLFLIRLMPGQVSYRDGAEFGHFAISGGFAEVGQDRVTILAETAEEQAEIDEVRASRSKEAAQAELLTELSTSELEAAQARLERAVARLKVATKQT